jgi:hypothetical protein
MVRGVSTRDYARVIEPARDRFGVAKSSISRGFVRASATNVQGVAECRFKGQRFGVVIVDCVEYTDQTVIGK